MNKIELVQALKDANGLSKKEVEMVVNLFFNEMTEAMARCDRVEIRGFCSLLSRNTVHTQAETPKPGKWSKSRLRNPMVEFST